MRNAQRNCMIILGLSVLLSVILMFASIYLMITASVAETTPLEELLGDTDYAIGNNYGMIYSIDGKELAGDYNGGNQADSPLFVSNNGFTNIIGSEYGGMIYQCKPILLANDNQLNRSQRRGNNIITTLHPAGQLTAVQMLEDYDVEQIDASITVMTRDGALLVSAGNNASDESSFAAMVEPKDLYVDYSSSAKEKGSCFKPVTYRMLLQNADRLPENLDITSDDGFEDVSYVTVNGSTVNNWDWKHPDSYEYNQSGLYIRYCSLSELLQRSSNTAPLRCARELGFREAYEEMKRMYGIDRPLITEFNSISGISVSNDRLPWLFFGQDACLSGVRMCQLYNHFVSGKFYSPFYVAAITRPDGNTVYKASPSEKQEYHMDIDVENDILNNALEDTFESYLTNSLRAAYPNELLTSRRILAKSGTAENADDTENRTIVLTLLNETRSDVVCSACISVNHVRVGSIGNAPLLDKLLLVLYAMEMI